LPIEGVAVGFVKVSEPPRTGGGKRPKMRKRSNKRNTRGKANEGGRPKGKGEGEQPFRTLGRCPPNRKHQQKKKKV